VQEREDELIKQNVDDKKAQVLAHKAAMNAIRRELEKVKDDELEAMRHQCNADLGKQCLLNTHIVTEL